VKWLVRERDRTWMERGAAFSPAAGIAAALVIAVAFAPLAPDLWHAWRTDPYAGHGMFVPVYAAFLLWMDRERLRGTPRRSEPAGALVVLAALALFAVGRAAGDLTLQVVSLAIALAGSVLLSFGWAALRAAAFPLGFLVLVLPLPRPIVHVISLPIQRFAAAFTGAVLTVAGVPHHQSGVFIELPRITLEVAEGCNGLRFLMALVTLTAAFAQATQRTTAAKVVLVAAAIPVAILANDVRVATLALAGYYIGPQAAVGLTHHSIGKGIWALALVPLAVLGVFLRRRKTSRRTPSLG
jgi:exosortase